LKLVERIKNNILYLNNYKKTKDILCSSILPFGGVSVEYNSTLVSASKIAFIPLLHSVTSQLLQYNWHTIFEWNW